MARRGARWRPTPVLVAVVVVLAAGCGGDADDPTEGQALPTAGPDPRSATSSPFTVGDPPDGFVARSAGRGSQEPLWGEDSFGTDEPYLVLSPDGTPDHPDVVLVSITGYQGYQSGLDQASPGGDEVEVDGAEARFAPAIGADDPHASVDGPRWADLVVAQGEEDLALRVTAPQATLDELAALVPHVVVPEETTQPPEVPDPPDGLQVVGAVDAFALIAAHAHVDQQSDGGPGPTTAHGVGWRRGGDHQGDQVTVLTLPGRSADLDALVVGYRREWERRGEVETAVDDDHATLEHVDPAGGATRSAWVAAPDGDLVVAGSSGVDPLPTDALLALARSVEPTDEATWDAVVEDVRGGPGFHADPGRTELMRGPVGDGREWLLQTQSPGEANMGVSYSNAPMWSVDPCLEISDGGRECRVSEGGSPDTWTAVGTGEQAGVAYVIVATIRPEAAALRVTTDGQETTVPLVAVPGTEEKAAAVVGEGHQLDLCFHEVRATGPRIVELVDAAGAPLTC